MTMKNRLSYKENMDLAGAPGFYSGGAPSFRLAFPQVLLSVSFLFMCFSTDTLPLICSCICGTHKPVCVSLCVYVSVCLCP